jgi:hypothetical protein
VAGTGYTDGTAANGTTYYYKVTAVNGGGGSGYSNEASATPEPTAPPAPTNLTATAGSALVNLAWTASSGATSYSVYRGLSTGGESTTPIATGVASTSYKDSGLVDGTTYYYYVTAINGGGTSGPSNEASAMPEQVPSYPAGLSFFSSPYGYTNPLVPLDTLFGYTGVKLAVWQPGAFAYAITPNSPADSIQLGIGYWGRFPQAVTFTSIGEAAPANQPFPIILLAGWNQVGDPFNASIPQSSLTFGYSDIPFSQASSGSSPIVDPTFYSYSGSSNSYTASTSLNPYQGYWVYAYSDTIMNVPAP